MTKTIGTSALIDVWASAGERLTPDDEKVAAGWQRSEQPPAEWMNDRHYQVESRLNHLLKNGIPEWDVDTEYDAGDFCKHGGNLYRSATTNSGSEPPSADWGTVSFISPEGGWSAPTGTATRTTFATGSVTTAQLAEHVKALIDDLLAMGILEA